MTDTNPTTQHHAADPAQRVADLEAERDKLAHDHHQVRADAQARVDAAVLRALAAERERDELRARRAEIEQQEPVYIACESGRVLPNANNGPEAYRQNKTYRGPLYAHPVPAIPDGCGACGDACKSRQSCRLADESPEMIPTTVCALEFRRDQCGLDQRQWAWVLGMQPSHYSEVVAGKRTLPKSAMARAFAYGVPAVALFQRLPNLGAADIDRRLTQMSAAAPEAAR